MTKIQISKETIEKCLQDGVKTMSELYRKMGGKSKASSSFSLKIRTLCPNVDDRLKANQGATAKESDKPVKSPTAQKAQRNPYRTGSAYALIWDCLYQTRSKGINCRELLKQVMKLSHKQEKNCKFNISVVTSPREDGSCHRSAKGASEIYWVERQNDWLKLHIRNATE